MKLPTLVKGLLCPTVIAGCIVATPALAVPLTVDQLIGVSHLKNSGDGTTLNALADAAKLDLNGAPKTRVEQTGADLAMRDPESSDQWFINVGPREPGYFVLKFGTGGLETTSNTFFFKNVGELDKLVFSNEQVNFLSGGDCSAGNDNKCNIGRLSHYEFVGTAARTPDVPDEPDAPVQIPEPATIALLGVGLIGLLLGQRRRQR